MEQTVLPDSQERGRLGVMHVPRLVARMQASLMGKPVNDINEYHLDRLVYDGLGLGIQPAIRFLHDPAMDLERFEQWVESCHGGTLPRERVALTNAYLELALAGEDETPPAFGEEALPLSAEDLAFFDEQGYVVVKEAVPRSQAEAALSVVWEASGMSPDNPDSWYRNLEQFQLIMFPFFHHPTLDANRNAPRIRRAYQQLWRRERLVASCDRVSVNPPERPGYSFPGPHIHWDTSLKPPMPFYLQGVLYLTDTRADQGAFCCVPGFHRGVDQWVTNLPEGTHPRSVDFTDVLKPIPASAGDLIIFHHALPHGPSPNRADFPRVVQYVTLYPPGWRDLRDWV